MITYVKNSELFIEQKLVRITTSGNFIRGNVYMVDSLCTDSGVAFIRVSPEHSVVFTTHGTEGRNVRFICYVSLSEEERFALKIGGLGALIGE